MPPIRPVLVLLLLLPPLALVAGCADTAAFDREMAGYVGRTEGELVTGLGVPNGTYDVEGRRFLQYELRGRSAGPVVTPSIGIGIGGFSFGGGGGGFGVGTGLGFSGGPGLAPPCTVIFELREGRVRQFERRGGGCVA